MRAELWLMILVIALGVAACQLEPAEAPLGAVSACS